MSESGEHETEREIPEPAAPARPDSEPVTTIYQDPNADPSSDPSPPSAEMKPPEHRKSWEEITPPRHREADEHSSSQTWSASEVTVFAPPNAPESEEPSGGLSPPILADAEAHAETSGTVDVPGGIGRAHRSSPREALSSPLAGTRAGIELGRPVFAVAAIGGLVTLGALLLWSLHASMGVAIGAATATANLWMFTRIGTVLTSERRRLSWGVLAGVKLIVLFGGVMVLLKMEIADPVAFLVGYLALPVGIVSSQLLGLAPDYEES